LARRFHDACAKAAMRTRARAVSGIWTFVLGAGYHVRVM
jgi:hypothetical protein